MTVRRAVRPWIPMAVLTITTAIYLPALTFQFACDDNRQIVFSAPHLTWRALPSYFTRDLWSYSTPVHTNYYRPVFLVWLMLNHEAFGLDPLLWHLSTILVHLAATLLFYFLARRLLKDDITAGVAALLFGIHPVHAEAVAWISGATESIFAVLAFATLLCHLRWIEDPRPLWRYSAVALFAGALLAKETAIVVPVLICAYAWLFPQSETAGLKQRLRSVVDLALPYFGVMILYVGLRLHALGTMAPFLWSWTLPMLLGTWPSAIGFYLRQLLLPVQYSFFYPIGPVKQIGLTNFFLPLLATLVAAAALVQIFRRSRAMACSVLLLVAPLLPVLNLRAFSFDDYLHDRYLYLAAGGFCLIVAQGLTWLSRGHQRRLAVATVLLAVPLAALTVRASDYWKDNLSLYTRADAVAPESPIAQAFLGLELLTQKRYTDALPLLKAALALRTESYQLDQAIAECYSAMDEYDQADAYLRDAVVLRPMFPDAYFALAELQLRRGKLDEAEAQAQKALQLRPAGAAFYVRFHSMLGQILEAKGDLPGALAEYQQELRDNPELDDVRDLMQKVSTRLGHP